jgi:hypothetical protein
METLTGAVGLTIMVIGFDVAGLPVAQGAAFDVNTQVMTCPLSGVYV